MAWKKITETSDWGYLKYGVSGWPKVDAKNTLQDGTTHVVRFPDGCEIPAAIRHVEHVERVNDMGHESTVTSAKLYIPIDYHGVSLLVPITAVRVWLE